MAANSRAHSSKIARFYKVNGDGHPAVNFDGRSLDDILAFDERELEYNHDYIQVLFPLPERSPVNPDAPVITKSDQDAFLQDDGLRERLALAFAKMAHFYGFDVASPTNDPIISPKANFRSIARQNWLAWSDHNHLRISRIIRCLRILGLEPLALAFYRALADKADGVSPRSLMYWKRAAERPLHLPPSEDDESARGVLWLRAS